MLRPIREPHPKRRRVAHLSALYEKCGTCADMRCKGACKHHICRHWGRDARGTQTAVARAGELHA